MDLPTCLWNGASGCSRDGQVTAWLCLLWQVREVTGADTFHRSVLLGISKAFKVIAEGKPEQIPP